VGLGICQVCVVEGASDMPLDYSSVWYIVKGAFTLLATLFAALGFGEYGGRVMAALFILSLFYLSGVFKKTRRVVGLALALVIVILVLANYF